VNKGVALVGGVGVGAALMYFLDPDRGKRRRRMVSDKAVSATNKVTETATRMNHDLRNRAYGLFCEARGLFKSEDVTDDVLMDRVRAKLGRVSHNLGALNLGVQDGVVSLKGACNSNELKRVLRAVGLVRGVKAVDNQLDVQGEDRFAAGQEELAAAR